MRVYVCRTLLLIVLLITVALPAWPQPPSETSAEVEWEPVAEGDQAGGAATTAGPAYLSVLDVIGKLTVAVLVAYALSLAVRWAQQHYPRTHRPAQGHSMRLEEVLPLGPDAKLYIVLAEGRRLLLASQGGNIHHLADLDHGPPVPSARFSSASNRPEGERDELNIVHAPLSTRAVRSDVVSDQDAWARRREQLLQDLEDS